MGSTGTVDSAVFERLQANIDEDVAFRERLRTVLQGLEKQVRSSLAVLARAHSTSADGLSSLATEAEAAVKLTTSTLADLSQIASEQPYYKYSQIWSRDVQDSVFTVLYTGWLGAFGGNKALLTLEEVGNILQLPVNVKGDDKFHINIEEYLQALISLVDELARLAVNSVTLGDYERPMRISQFVKDVHAGFQMLNLKNDSLRRRSDSLKYSVKKVEDVVYDLSLRNLLPKG